MSRVPILFWSLALTAAPAAAQQSAAPRSTANAALVFPLTLITKQNLDFGYVATVGAGTVVINPVTGGVTVTGGVSSVGGEPHPATFIGAARNNAVVVIRIPKQPITIRRQGGTETMQVRDFTLQGGDRRTLARMEAFEFNVGATLVVGASQAEGVYSGEFDVTVQYP